MKFLRLMKIQAENCCVKFLRKIAAENLGGHTEFMRLVKFRRAIELWRMLKSPRQNLQLLTSSKSS